MMFATTAPDQQQVRRAAAFVLKSLASQEGALLAALTGLGLWRDKQAPSEEVLLPEVHLSDAFDEQLVTSWEGATGMQVDAFEKSVIEQLKQVVAFAHSDGGATNENIRAAERLIRSGRLDLFVR